MMLGDIRTTKQQKKVRERRKKRADAKEPHFLNLRKKKKQHVVGSTWTSYIINRFICVCGSCAYTKLVH
jgi:hypothetical protein